MEAFKDKIVLIKYGGNAMLNKELKLGVLQNICALKDAGLKPVVVHGGGPFIKDILAKVGVESEFIDGHRKTTPEALRYIEMALKGEVNGDLVRLLNKLGKKAVGLSGKDGKMLTAKKRLHTQVVEGKEVLVDLQQVGDVASVSTNLLRLLLDNNFIPVIATIASGDDGLDYNINADMFAGHLAGELQSEVFVAMTDVDGLYLDHKDASTLVKEITVSELEAMYGTVIQGGMIPKMESLTIALKKGVSSVRIINGTRKNAIVDELQAGKSTGTMLHK